MAAHGQGPIRAAENGNAQAVEDLIALLRLLTGTGDERGIDAGREEGDPRAR